MSPPAIGWHCRVGVRLPKAAVSLAIAHVVELATGAVSEVSGCAVAIRIRLAITIVKGT